MDEAARHDGERRGTAVPASAPGTVTPTPTPTHRGPVPHGLRRTRLLDLLRPASRLTVVVAPAGSGKTTLLAQYAAETAHPVAWLRAVGAHRDPPRLVEGLRRALTAAGVPVDPDTTDLADLVAPSGPLTLVVDDTHLLLDTPAEEHLERLLADGHPALSVVLASRRAPGVNLCRAELGDVTLVTADDLRFRSWEVETLFRDHYHEPLPPVDIAALTRRTDGWAACLRLFQLSTRSRPLPERRRAVAALAGGPRYARAYLARTVLAELPVDLRTFLSRTAVFEVLTAERCDRLLGSRDAQARLEQLASLEALTTSDDGGRSFRYHEVLRGHLESALADELGADGSRAWYGFAAELLEAQGALGEALRAWLRAERWEEATRLLRSGGRAIAEEPGAPGSMWPEVLPAELVDDDPWLSTAIARRLAAEGRLDAAERRYRQAESLFPDATDRERVTHERRLVELWTTGRPQPHLHWMDRLRDAVRRRPGQLRRDPTIEAGPGDRLGEAVAALLTGDVEAAARNVGALLEDPVVDGPLLLAGRLVSELVDALRGVDVAACTEQLGADAERAGATWVARQARVLNAVVLGDGGQVGRVAAECAALGDEWGELLARSADVLRRLYAGEPAAAACRALLPRIQARDAAALQAWVATTGALAAVAEGEPAAAATARTVEAFSRASGVWGTQALTALALTLAGPDPAATDPAAPDPAPPPGLGQARALAEAHGLPWPATLVRRLAAPARPPVPALAPPPPQPDTAAVGAAAVGPAGSPPITVRCFGAFEIAVDGRPLHWRTVRPRAAAVLRLLAARAPDPVHRETLLALWPGLPPGQATHSLQVAVSTLRALLAPGAPRGTSRVIERVGETYALALPHGSSSDVRALRTALRDAERAARARDPDAERTALAAAVTAHRGDLLPEDGTAEWVLADRERWRLRAAAACARLAELRLTAGDVPGAVEAGRRGVEIDPFHDALWRTLVTCYTRTGDTAAAARARSDYAGVLAELGVPSPPTLVDVVPAPTADRPRTRRRPGRPVAPLTATPQTSRRVGLTRPTAPPP